MNYQEQFNHNEIEAIATKFTAGEFVNHDELKLWYSYKRTLKSDIAGATAFLKRIEEAHQDEPDWEEHEITTSIRYNTNKAETELRWIRSINTFPLLEFCNYYLKANNHLDYDTIQIVMANKVINGTSNTEEQLIRELFEESTTLKSINHFRDLTCPVTLRNWTASYNPSTTYHPTETPMDATELYDGRIHYIYIHSKNQARYGESYWISVDCSNSLGSLPVIKDFKNYKFQIGKFYKIQCTDTIYFGGNKKKYCMEIEESTEEEFMTKGFEQYLTRW